MLKNLRFDRSFFTRPTLRVAPELLGALLTTKTGSKVTSGMIVEVEAYRGDIDPACHCFRRRTKRTEVMYWEGGFSYVYSIYGLHTCFNVVTEAAEKGAAVLIRAVQPVSGIEIMRRRRSTLDDRELTSGPAKLCQALGITLDLWGENLLDSRRITLRPYRSFRTEEIARSKRIGIGKARNLLWRFYIKDNPWVSRGAFRSGLA